MRGERQDRKSREAHILTRLRGFDGSGADEGVRFPDLALHQFEIIHNEVAADIAALVANGVNRNRDGSVGNGEVDA